jgi:ribulose-bisphosphate carboxylase small chain
MRITQGTFSFLPDLTDDEIVKQVEYCLHRDWPINIEYTDDPHPRNSYWEMFGLPMFDQRDPAAIMAALDECRKTFPNHYIKINAYDRKKGRETVALSFIVNRPRHEPGFQVRRQEVAGRAIRYSIHAYATDKPEGERY